jgi:uridine kinase
MERHTVIARLAGRLAAIQRQHPVRVAIDGVDAAGKTTLADELVEPLAAHGRTAIRASIDGFHRPRAERYSQGADSPQGYYADSFDYAVLRDALLLPLGPGGSRRFRRVVFDVRRDARVVGEEAVAPPNAILLFDGVFLLRPELADLWDYHVFVDVASDVALLRALQRDQALFGSPDAVRDRYTRRYMPGQRLYLDAAHPRERADAVLWNDDPQRPRLTFKSE